MKKILIIGAGGVGSVLAQKCSLFPDVFTDICLASRTLEKCEKIQQQIKELTGRKIMIAQLDADIVSDTVELIRKTAADLVINVALPYQDLSIMDACLEAGANYLDTANYEPKEEAKFEYKWQWAYHDKFKAKGLMALLGCGFDPGVTNVFCAYAQKNIFDEIKTIDILDCNAGDHGKAFATNFNPEINIREVTQKGKYWEKGNWVDTPSILEDSAIHFSFQYPEVGAYESYLIYHEEEESLAKNIKSLERIRFWMTFSQSYLMHLKVLENIGMTSIETVEYEGNQIVPLKFLKSVLPEPSSLGENYSGKTVIGCVISGRKNGEEKSVYIYNICSHENAYSELRSQAVSYTTGVPAMIGAMMILKGIWSGAGVYNVEEFDPDPFMEQLNINGLEWIIEDFKNTI